MGPAELVYFRLRASEFLHGVPRCRSFLQNDRTRQTIRSRARVVDSSAASSAGVIGSTDSNPDCPQIKQSTFVSDLLALASSSALPFYVFMHVPQQVCGRQKLVLRTPASLSSAPVYLSLSSIFKRSHGDPLLGLKFVRETYFKVLAYRRRKQFVRLAARGRVDFVSGDADVSPMMASSAHQGPADLIRNSVLNKVPGFYPCYPEEELLALKCSEHDVRVLSAFARLHTVQLTPPDRLALSEFRVAHVILLSNTTRRCRLVPRRAVLVEMVSSDEFRAYICRMKPFMQVVQSHSFSHHSAIISAYDVENSWLMPPTDSWCFKHLGEPLWSTSAAVRTFLPSFLSSSLLPHRDIEIVRRRCMSVPTTSSMSDTVVDRRFSTLPSSRRSAPERRRGAFTRIDLATAQTVAKEIRALALPFSLWVPSLVRSGSFFPYFYYSSFQGARTYVIRLSRFVGLGLALADSICNVISGIEFHEAATYSSKTVPSRRQRCWQRCDPPQAEIATVSLSDSFASRNRRRTEGLALADKFRTKHRIFSDKYIEDRIAISPTCQPTISAKCMLIRFGSMSFSDFNHAFCSHVLVRTPYAEVTGSDSYRALQSSRRFKFYVHSSVAGLRPFLSEMELDQTLRPDFPSNSVERLTFDNVARGIFPAHDYEYQDSFLKGVLARWRATGTITWST